MRPELLYPALTFLLLIGALFVVPWVVQRLVHPRRKPRTHKTRRRKRRSEYCDPIFLRAGAEAVQQTSERVRQPPTQE